MSENTVYSLETERLIDYIKNNIVGLDLLGDMILKHAPLSSGAGIAITKKRLSQERIHKFKLGNYGKSSRKLAAEYIYKKFYSYEHGICISDEYDTDYDFEKNGDTFIELGLYFNQEVYYAVSKNELSQKNIETCLKHGNSIWHSLTVLSDIPFKKNNDQSISKADMIQIAKSAQMIALLAYDAEGYVIWERN
jgi:hypothetical protein